MHNCTLRLTDKLTVRAPVARFKRYKRIISTGGGSVKCLKLLRQRHANTGVTLLQAPPPPHTHTHARTRTHTHTHPFSAEEKETGVQQSRTRPSLSFSGVQDLIGLHNRLYQQSAWIRHAGRHPGQTRSTKRGDVRE